MKIIQSIDWIKSFFDQVVNFSVTANAKSAEIFQSKIGWVCVDMMNIQSFIRNFTEKTLLRKISVANKNVTPFFIPCSIERMLLSFRGKLAFSRTERGSLISKRPRLEKFFTNFAGLFDSGHADAFPRTKPICFNSINSRMKDFFTPLTFDNNFRSQNHKDQLYAD